MVPYTVETVTVDLKPGNVVTGLSRTQNRYGVESIVRSVFLPKTYIVTLTISGTNGMTLSLRVTAETVWYLIP